MSFIENALRLLEINSVTEHGNEEIINYLIPVFERMGMKLILQQVPHSLEDHSKRQFNLIGMLGDDLVDTRHRKGLLLTTHVDTASPGDESAWTELDGKPWTPRLIGDAVHGLGTARSKLDFYCKLVACERYLKTPLKEPIYLAATCGGESALAGSKYMIQSSVVNPRYVMVGHPTDQKLVYTHKAQLVFQVRLSYVAIERDAQEFNAKIQLSTTGRHGHVALDTDPDHSLAIAKIFYLLDDLRKTKIPVKLCSLDGSNSLNSIASKVSAGIVIPSRDMEEMREYFRNFVNKNPKHNYELKFGGTGDRGIRFLPAEVMPAIFAIRDMVDALQAQLKDAVTSSEFSPDYSTVSLSSITHERDSLSFRVQLHLLPELASNESKKNIELDLRRRVDAIAAQYRTLSVECRRLLSAPRYLQDPKSVFVSTLAADLERSGMDPQVVAGNTCTDATYFAERGYPTMVYGPGQERNNTHTPQERVTMDVLYAAVRFYTQAIETFCVRGI